MRNTENIPQDGLRTNLTFRNAILLICSCVAQMIIVCVNPGKTDLFKGIMVAVSLACQVLLVINIWRNTVVANRVPLYIRLCLFICFFQGFLLLTNGLVGGVISMVLCTVLLILGLKIVPDQQ